jgi:hypothetical protein
LKDSAIETKKTGASLKDWLLDSKFASALCYRLIIKVAACSSAIPEQGSMAHTMLEQHRMKKGWVLMLHMSDRGKPKDGSTSQDRGFKGPMMPRKGTNAALHLRRVRGTVFIYITTKKLE